MGGGYEVSRAVVDGGVGAETETAHALLVGACRHHHRAADRLDQGDRRGADAAAAAVHEDAAASPQATEAEDREEHREERLRKRRGLLRRHEIRDLHDAAGRGNHLLGVAAAGEQRHRAVAGPPPANAGPDLRYLAGALQSEDLGGSRRRRVLAHALQQVGAIEGCGVHPQPQLTRAERRRWYIGDPQHALVARTIEDDGFHSFKATTGIKRGSAARAPPPGAPRQPR